MEKNHEENTPSGHPKCTGANCDYAIEPTTGNGICFSGSGTCLACNLLEAEASPLHDEALIEATRKIKEVLSGIPADPDGRTLSFLVTEMGLLLAWVEHGSAMPENAVTAKNENAVLAQALKLTNWQADSTGSSSADSQ